MLAYTVPDWWTTPEGKAEAKSVVRETISIFGDERCMFASNFPAEPAGVGREQLYANFSAMVEDLSQEQRDGLFYMHAEKFYRIVVPE
mmetsp:Transcript_33745/g.68025  ORF Transcript_33745/g.68025 Transcript_33745/m.68025 type:complete len:88 (+) Transcript_33745:106-369(+)